MSKKFEDAEIKQIQFSLWSAEELKKFAVVKVDKSNRSGPGSIYDPKLGPFNNKAICQTCESPIKLCSGHFGFIDLEIPITHPLYINEIMKYLNAFVISVIN